MITKQELRRRLRKARRQHMDALPDAVRALVFNRPPAAITEKIPETAVIGFYRAIPGEAPTDSYARWFFERGHRIALPAFDGFEGAMHFRQWANPYVDDELEPGAFGLQPPADAPEVVPDVLFVPLVGFTERGERIGQGGGHYDRWLAAHPGVLAIGLAWDAQKVDFLPVEEHDMPLSTIVTPTRLYGPF
ncbi:5-formyltetrahydrofolate cyclo-ligase [Altericroceibacterium xinjiangense]|uniref:5-formyltetrahydrofolate cyclo-ligase n=1 Tax=Altericroceibacterium xinjiangense TaxID=762261 RepID=UPI000F7E3664|nr:5-formyltetrahydrofolate cyclo-ligase [Altericroceibacterium xinjiangense]